MVVRFVRCASMCALLRLFLACLASLAPPVQAQEAIATTGGASRLTDTDAPAGRSLPDASAAAESSLKFRHAGSSSAQAGLARRTQVQSPGGGASPAAPRPGRQAPQTNRAPESSAPRQRSRSPLSNLSVGAGAAGRPNGQTNNQTSSSTSLTNVPLMVGDTTGGGCGGLTISGSLAASIMHPTFACSRLNISENNTAVLLNRLYFNYRHFENESKIDIFSYSPLGGRASLDLDRYVLGGEKIIGGSTSIEFRLPINRQLTSNLVATQTGTPTTPSVSSLPLHDRDTTFGNLGLILKQALIRNESIYLSSGLGLNLPTAPDVTITGRINDTHYAIYDPVTGNRINTIDLNFAVNGVVKNQTVNLSPFLAYYTPSTRWFSQGFLQFDVPLNRSTASISESLSVLGANLSNLNVSGRLAQQTLMRINIGAGYWVVRNKPSRLINALAIMAEVHYSTTLNNADLLGPVQVAPATFGLSAVDLTVGNIANRVDVLDFALAVPLWIGRTNITNGFVAPARTGADRGFDFEYSLLVNRTF